MLKNNKGFQVSKVDSDNFRKGVLGLYEAKRYNCFVDVVEPKEIVNGLIYAVENPKILVTDVSKMVGISNDDLKQALFKGGNLNGKKARIKGIDLEIIEATENGFACQTKDCTMYLLLQE